MASSCEHLDKYVEENGSRSYKLIHLFYISAIAKGSRKIKAVDLACHTCEEFKRLHACLECSYFGCYSKKCIYDHSEKNKHFFGVEMTYGAVYCFICNDYMYHAELIKVNHNSKVLESKVYGVDLLCFFNPSSEEVLTVNEFVDKKGVVQGLRGIKNFGNTCYISSIMQVLLHTPILREYFLSDKHVCLLNSTDCMMCEMTNLFQEFYSGKQKALLPTNLVYLVKKYLPQFQLNDQQDIDEFLLPFIDVMCNHSKGILDRINHVNPNECECIMHRAFSWLLRVDICCQKCLTASSSNVLPECFMRLQIETDGSDGDEVKKDSSDNEDGSDNDFYGPVLETKKELKTVEDCLDWHCEHHLSAESYCTTCSKMQPKQNKVTFKRLPIIACFWLQRLAPIKTVIIGNSEPTFEKVEKIEKIVEFNNFLDLSKYMSSPQKNNLDIWAEYDKTYSLYAVVCHKGTEKFGHYGTYVKMNDSSEEWYEFNDEVVTKFDREKINSLQGYMCFYHKRILDYNA